MLSGRFRSVVPLCSNRLMFRLMEIMPSSGVPARLDRMPAGNLRILHTCFAWRSEVATRSSAAKQRVPSHRYCSAGRLRALSIGGADTSSVVNEHDEEAAAPVIDIPSYCSGCGVKLQKDDTDAPGFFQLPKNILQPKNSGQGDNGLEFQDDGPLGPGLDAPRPATSIDGPPAETTTSGRAEEEAAWGYDMLVEDEESWEGKGKKRGPKQFQKGFEEEEEEREPSILCARCFSLQNYGKVRSLKAEAALPEFDLGRKVGRKIALQKFRRPVILCVIDLADFDGSIPRLALGSLLPRSMHERTREWQRRDESAKPVGWNADHKGGMEECRLVLVANKSDLLPRQATKTRLEAWVRQRAVQAGLPRPDSVHLVSSTKQIGVSDLLEDLHKLAGPAGDVWVVGAQNAGKSSLINAMRRSVGRTSPKKDVTTAALPGTTLGMLRIDGIMRGRCRMFDTPGVPHQYQLSSRLSPDEVRLLLPRGRLAPRTFRLGTGQTVFVGGVLRLDAVTSSASNLYFTVWASADIPCHFGKTETADERYAKMAGSALIPPLGDSNRLQKLGPLLPADVEISGRSFKASSMDVAVAGLGWIAVAVSGKASLRAWTHHGVAVTVREALIPDLASELERPGLGNRTRQPPRAAKRKIK